MGFLGLRHAGVDGGRVQSFRVVGDFVKTCKRCGDEKPLDAFSVRSASKDGRQSYCKPCHNAVARARAAADPEKRALEQRRSYIKRTYGITVEQYDEMYERQGGKCFICENEEATHVDHCHDSGDVRALLCHGCNSAIGLMKEDPDILIAGAMYVLMHQGAYDVHS